MEDQKIIIINVCAENSIKIIKWKVREGFQVTSGQLILLYELPDSDDKEIKRLKSTNSGVVRRRLFKDGDVVDKNCIIFELSECRHTTVIKDMCADCGADLRQNENGNVSEAFVPMVHSVPELKVTQKLALKLGQADTDRLLQDRKLVLLVDLDQTLIHTTNESVPNNLKDVYHFQLYGQNAHWYHTRLRPGTPQFLANIAPYFELHICTFGARDYAHTITNFLDEDGKYFSHRILSRDECFNATSKIDNLKALFPCGDSMVCIIDDREDVWNMTSNLIQVKPYHFFQHTGDINAPPGLSRNDVHGKHVDFKDLTLQTKKEKNKEEESSQEQPKLKEDNIESIVADEKITEKDADEIKSLDITESMLNNEIVDEVGDKKTIDENNDIKLVVQLPDKKIDENKSTNVISTDDDHLIEIEDPDDYLLYLEEILKQIHKRFYSIYETTKEMPDLKLLIPKIRSEVLVGKHLVFSGLVPNHMKLTQSKAYQIATSLGAIVTQMLEDKTTHLVAVTAGTLKVNAARKLSNVKIVRPDWLWSCAERWECVEEKLFPLNSNKLNKSRQPPPHCQSPEHAVNYNVKSETDTVKEPKFIDTINPLLSFSTGDIAKMNEEFEEFFESSSSDDEPVDIENPPVNKILRKRKRQDEKEDVNVSFFSRPEAEKLEFVQDEENISNEMQESSSSEDEMPSAKFRRGCDLPSDLSDAPSEDGSENHMDEDDSEWNMMGAALEREFLGLE